MGFIVKVYKAGKCTEYLVIGTNSIDIQIDYIERYFPCGVSVLKSIKNKERIRR